MDRTKDTCKQKNGDLVFYVRIQYRCNSSWQGTVQWMEGKQERKFRSVLELGNLINNAKHIRSADKKKAAPKWEDKESVS